MPQIDLRHIAVDATEELVSSYTVGIVTDDQGEPGNGIGTGVAIEWGNRLMILTAKHVIEDTPPDRLGFFFKPAGGMERVYLQQKEAGARFVRRQRLPVQEICTLQDWDLAVIRLLRDIRGEQNIDFLRIDGNNTSPPIGSTVMMIGFPRALAEEVSPGSMAANRAIAFEKLVDPSLGSSFDDACHFALAYTFGNDLSPDGLHPGGFSGAGAWCDSGASGVVWHAQPRLAGIITTYVSRKRIITGIRIETVVGALAATFGSDQALEPPLESATS